MREIAGSVQIQISEGQHSGPGVWEVIDLVFVSCLLLLLLFCVFVCSDCFFCVALMRVVCAKDCRLL